MSKSSNKVQRHVIAASRTTGKIDTFTEAEWSEANTGEWMIVCRESDDLANRPVVDRVAEFFAAPFRLHLHHRHDYGRSLPECPELPEWDAFKLLPPPDWQDEDIRHLEPGETLAKGALQHDIQVSFVGHPNPATMDWLLRQSERFAFRAAFGPEARDAEIGRLDIRVPRQLRRKQRATMLASTTSDRRKVQR